MAMAIDVNAHAVEQVDSIDMGKRVIYSVNNMEVVDTIDCSTIETPLIPQIPFAELDSLTMSSLDNRYVVVYKDGKCGVYDLLNEENITRIEYNNLKFSFRKEMEGGYYFYFYWEKEKNSGFVGIAEMNNHFISIALPKKDEQEVKH